MDERSECTDLADLLAEVATGAASGPDRARVLRHLSTCEDCRQELAELSDTADELLHIAPEREAPAGFEGAVLARLTGSEVPQRERRRRWGWLTSRPVLAGAAAAVFGLGGAGVVWQATSDDRDLAASYRDTLDVADGQYFTAVDLIGPSGTSAGTVFMYEGDPSWYYVVVRDAPTGTYDVVISSGGRTEAVGDCVVGDDGTCGSGGTIDVHVYDIDDITLVTADGTTLRSEPRW